ncbi:MAG: hypothetical protein MJ219_02020 [Mycoplasmoidaceae bacterium]|nr:hypothetical protein [Mycoplasmoidaceae bacterium]
MFALANLVNTEDGKNVAMLKTSHVNFEFNTMPLPSYSFSPQNRLDFSNSFKNLLEGNAAV